MGKTRGRLTSAKERIKKESPVKVDEKEREEISEEESEFSHGSSSEDEKDQEIDIEN